MAAVVPGFGASLTVDASGTGRYFDNSLFIAGDYGTGWHSGLPSEARSFFGFDLSGVTGTVISATLHLETSTKVSPFLTPTGTETCGLFDVSAALGTLTSGAGAGSFGDLGSGTSYGSLDVTNPVGSFIDISLNAAGIAYLNGLAGGTAVIGGAITSLDKGVAPANEIVFNGSTGSMTRQLLLETDGGTGVPEPGTWMLMGGGMLALAVRRRMAERLRRTRGQQSRPGTLQ